MNVKELNLYLILGILFVGSSLLLILSGLSLLQLFNVVIGVLLILYGIFRKRGYMNRAFYLSILGFMVFYGLILICFYVLAPVYTKDPIFYIFVFLFIFLIIRFLFEYKMMRKYHKCVEAYEIALKKDPNNVIALNNKGATLAEFKAYPEAIKCFNEVLEMDPENAAAWHNKGVILATLGKPQEAVKYFDKALEVDPRFVNAKKSGQIILEI